MFWDEDDKQGPYEVPDDVIDIGFKVIGKAIPLEHSQELSLALQKHLPWISDDKHFGIHQIHGAESGNGWIRPENTENELLYLSRRNRMYLRTPNERADEVKQLVGKTINVAGHELELGAVNVRPLSMQSEQFARYVIVEPGEVDEEDFLKRVVDELQQLLAVRVRKILCGKPHTLRGPEGDINTRSVMVADLEPEPAVKLQQYGIGRGRLIGCGLFLPHKGIKAVGETEDKTHFTGAK